MKNFKVFQQHLCQFQKLNPQPTSKESSSLKKLIKIMSSFLQYLKNSSKENFETTNFKFYPFPVKIKHFLGILITNGFLQLLNIKEKFFSKMLIKFLQHCCDQIKVFINQCNKLCSKHNKEVSQLR